MLWNWAFLYIYIYRRGQRKNCSKVRSYNSETNWHKKVKQKPHERLRGNCFVVKVPYYKIAKLCPHLRLQWLGWETASKTTSFRIDLNSPGQPDPLTFPLWRALIAMPDPVNSRKQVVREIISSINKIILVSIIPNFQKKIDYCIQHLGVILSTCYKSNSN